MPLGSSFRNVILSRRRRISTSTAKYRDSSLRYATFRMTRGLLSDEMRIRITMGSVGGEVFLSCRDDGREIALAESSSTGLSDHYSISDIHGEGVIWCADRGL